jgi:hypothetical protein
MQELDRIVTDAAGGHGMVDYVRFAESQFDVHGHLPPMLQGIKGRDSGDIIGWRTPPQRVDVRASDCMLSMV